jgi:glycosyltransferase involved in cell wall biosynthesis
MISAIITTFNYEAFLPHAIESVLNQTLPPDEVIIVDDGSTDRSAELVRRYGRRILYVWQANQGPGTARNLGIRISRGDLIAFLDSDDLWFPRKLELQNAALARDGELDLVFGRMIQFRGAGPHGIAGTVEVDEAGVPAPLISCLMARRTAFDRVGSLREDLQTDFVEWYLRAQHAGLHMLMLDELIVKRRIHEENFTKRNDVRREYLLSLKASLDQRRAKAKAAGPEWTR